MPVPRALAHLRVASCLLAPVVEVMGVSELEEVCRAAAVLRAERRWGLLATVVNVEGSAFRRPGARMLVAGDAWLAGAISAGALERDVLARGVHRTRGGPIVVRYDACEGSSGVVDVLLERLDPLAPFDPLEFVAGCVAAEPPGALVTITSGPSLGRRIAVREGDVIRCEVPELGFVDDALSAIADGGSARYVRDGDVTALVEVIRVAPRLFVVGTQHDAHALFVLGKAVGLSVTVFGTAISPSLRERFGDALVAAEPDAVGRAVSAHQAAAVVIMSHDEARDRACLEAVLATPARYVRVPGPTDEPNDVALAIVAEIKTHLARSLGA